MPFGKAMFPQTHFCLCHTFASLLVKQGAHQKYNLEQMSHSGIQVAMDVYGRLFPRGKRAWVGKLYEKGWEAKSAARTGWFLTAEL